MPDAVHTPTSPTPPRRWWVLPLSAAALLLAAVVGWQIISALFGLLNPPPPPLPSRVTELSHQSEAYGVDVWGYSADLSPVELLAYYAQSGGRCADAPFSEADTDFLRSRFPQAGELIARCQGEQPFARFSMRWQVLISRSGGVGDPLRLDVIRQVNWSGSSSPQN